MIYDSDFVFSDSDHSKHYIKMNESDVLPPIVLQQVKHLISKNREIGEKSFASEFLFFKMFHKKLDPSEFGYTSMNSLLCALATSDVPVLQIAYENCQIVVRPSKETLRETRGLRDAQCDLSELDTEASRSVTSSNLPPRETILRGGIPQQELPHDLIEGKHFPIVMTQVESPGKFWASS